LEDDEWLKAVQHHHPLLVTESKKLPALVTAFVPVLKTRDKQKNVIGGRANKSCSLCMENIVDYGLVEKLT